MLQVTADIVVDENEIEERFIRASGPGGQHVNKVSSAVQLRFDVRHSLALPEAVRARLIHLAGHRMTGDGVLVIDASRFRSQERNREDARERLITLIRVAAMPPRPRRPTRLPQAAKQRRLTSKRHRSGLKQQRQTPVSGGDE